MKDIRVNGKKLTDRQVLLLTEAINGHYEIGVQYESYLADACDMSVEEQKEIVGELHRMIVM